MVAETSRARTAGVWALLLLIIALGAFLRFYRIGSKSLWLDETATMKLVDRPYAQVLLAVSTHDAHPPLYYAELCGWMHGSRDGVRARAFSAVVGVATLAVFYALARVLLPRWAALSGTLLLAVSAFQVYFAQEARLYALAVFFTTVSWYFFVQLVAGRRLERWQLSIGLAVANAAALYTFYYTAFAIAAQLLVLLLVWREVGRKLVLPWLAWQLLPAAAFGFYVPVITMRMRMLAGLTAPVRYSVASAAGLSATATQFVAGFLRELSGGYGAMAGALAVVVAILVLAVGALSLRGRWTAAVVGLVWLLAPLALLALVSGLFKGHTYEPKHLIVSTPAMALVVAVGLVWVRGRLRALAIGTAVALVALNVCSLVCYYRTGVEKENWRAAIGRLNELAVPGDFVCFNPPYLRLPFVYYYSGPPVLECPSPVTGKPFRSGELTLERRMWLLEARSNVAIPNPLVAEALSPYPVLFHERYEDLLGRIDLQLFDARKAPAPKPSAQGAPPAEATDAPKVPKKK